MQQAWWESSVAYQVYMRSFQDSNGDGIGDLKGVLQRLPYLQELGVDIVWLSPIYLSPNDDNGYDISDYQAIQPEYGTMEDFDALLFDAHARGMRVVMDLVVNHTSDEHPWFIESRSSKNSPQRDWYIWHDGKDGNPPNNWGSIFGGSAWELDEASGQYYLHLFSKKMPDINWENPGAREVVFDMVNWWLDKGIDGFRVDAISHIKKEDYEDLPDPDGRGCVSSFDKHLNRPGVLELLAHLKNNAFAGRDIFTVAEANGVNSTEALGWVSKKDGIFSSIFQFEHRSLWNMDGTERFSLPEIKQALSKWQDATATDGNVALVLENHDLTRCVNKFGSTGEYWKESAKCLAMMYMLQKGVPFIYQGQELGMTDADYTDVNDYRDAPAIQYYQERIDEGMSQEKSFRILKGSIRDNCRTPMQWDAQENGGFTTGTPWIAVNSNHSFINADNEQRDPDSVLNFYKKLIQIRKNTQTLILGSYRLLLPDDEQIYAYERTLGTENYLIICNVSAQEVSLTIDIPGGALIFGNYLMGLTNSLRPYECRLYRMAQKTAKEATL